MFSDREKIHETANRDLGRVELLPVVTLVVWLSCLAVGQWQVGLVNVKLPPTSLLTEPTQATFMTASLNQAPQSVTDAPLPAEDAAPVPATISVPQPVQIGAAPAFAVPVAPSTMSALKALAVPPPAAPTYKKISYGSGEGAQPQPDYPIEAYTAGQTGTVVVRYRVSEGGTVSSTEIVKPSPWPLLNQAAARSIRETWTYLPGPVRYFEISITYRIKSDQ